MDSGPVYEEIQSITCHTETQQLAGSK